MVTVALTVRAPDGHVLEAGGGGGGRAEGSLWGGGRHGRFGEATMTPGFVLGHPPP